VSLSVRFTSVLGLTLVLAGMNAAQVAPRRSGPPQKPTDQNPEIARWVPSKVAPLTVAQKADARVAGLSQAACEATMRVVMPRRKGSGSMTLESFFGGRQRYLIQFPVISFVKRDELSTALVRSDGKKVFVLKPSKPGTVMPVGTAKLVAQATPVDWAMGHLGFIFGAALGEKPLTDLVRQASKPGSGYRVKTEERVVRRLNVPNRQYRIVVARVGAAAQKLGAFEVNVVVDGKQWLPTTVVSQSDIKGKGREPFGLMNNLRWKARKTPFDPKTFALK
jgi:hypothetical protein